MEVCPAGKKGLVMIFGVKKFNQYVLGRKFRIYFDRKPLQDLFSESCPVSAVASARVQRWELTLGAYDYTICYQPGKHQANADSLSHLPLPESPQEVATPAEIVFIMETLLGTPVDAEKIR